MIPAAYCRYSSDSQRDASIDDQLRNITNYCDRMGWPAPVLFQDAATSGALLQRAGLDAMQHAAQHHQFNVLLVDDLSRLGRDMAETPRIVKQLKFMGIRVIGVSDGVDTDREGYKAQIGLHGIMGEMYLDDLAKKTHRGLTGLALAGKSAGGLAYGYKSVAIDDGFTREIDPEQARWVLWIFEQYAAGHPPRTIANKLNEQKVPSSRGSTWSFSAIYGDYKRGIGILCNRMYSGEYVWNRSQWIKDPSTGRRKRIERPESEWIINQMPELRIIPPELWAAVQRRQLATRNKSRTAIASGKGAGGRGPKYLFSSLLKCGNCSGNYNMVNKSHYGCARHKDRGKSVCSNHLTVSREVIEERLLAGIKNVLLSEKNFERFSQRVRQQLKERQPDTGSIKKQITQARHERDNIMSAIRQGILTPTTKEALETAESKLQEAEQQLASIKSYQPAQVLPRAREIFEGMVKHLEQINDVPAAREAIKQITGDITIHPEQGKLVAELQGRITTLQHSKISMVAGAGFEPTTFGL